MPVGIICPILLAAVSVDVVRFKSSAGPHWDGVVTVSNPAPFCSITRIAELGSKLELLFVQARKIDLNGFGIRIRDFKLGGHVLVLEALTLTAR